MTPKYDFKNIENNWKDKWYQDNMYEAVDFSPKPKKYILAELPYPSGKYLHIGHAIRYTVPDIYSRFLRMRGYNVMFPLGWDAFGLPAEVFAIKEGISPKEAIAQACKDYKKVVQNVGYAIDWKRELNTSDPKYYKWTQWIFLKLWEAGLAEVKEMPVWWCKELGILADEEILTDSEGNKISEKGSHRVERKMFRQWVLKIPEYADKLLEGLDEVEVPDSVRAAQKSWIGKKEGANVDFEVDGTKLTVFTTRPDTIFGVSFLAISPEHKDLEKLLKNVTNKNEVSDYIQQAKQLTDIERQAKKKTGVKLEGVSAKHPFVEFGMEIPVFVADYILADFGTGAIMGVPAHDERDGEFAKDYDLEVIEVIGDDGFVKNSGTYDGKLADEFKDVVVTRLESEQKGKKSTTYKLRDQIWSRQRFWGDPIPLIHKQDGSVEANYNLPVELPEIDSSTIVKGAAFPPLSEFKEWVPTKDSSGNPATKETDTMPTWAGSNWYYLRYIDPGNSSEFANMDKMKYWMPVDHYFGGTEHTTVHLLYSRFWYRFLFDHGLVPTKEPYAKRTNGGLLLGPDGFKMSKSRGNVLNPQDVIDMYGADVFRMYLAFIGPYEDTYPWNPSGIKACYRLMSTIYEMKDIVSTKESPLEITKALHVLIRKNTEMSENLKMNTAVSEIMKFVNILKKESFVNISVWKDLVKVIAPFAPFTAEELWQEVNNYKVWNKENSVHLQEWPVYDSKLATEDVLDIPVQINGKMRGQISIVSSDTEESLKEKAIADDKIGPLLSGKEIKRLIYIPGKILNLVI